MEPFNNHKRRAIGGQKDNFQSAVHFEEKARGCARQPKVRKWSRDGGVEHQGGCSDPPLISAALSLSHFLQSSLYLTSRVYRPMSIWGEIFASNTPEHAGCSAASTFISFSKEAMSRLLGTYRYQLIASQRLYRTNLDR